MESLLNAGLGIGILMFLVLLFKQKKRIEDYLFLSWIATTLLQIIFYLITIYHFELTGLWAILTFGLPLLGAPLLFFYIRKLTGHKITLITIIAHLGIYPIYVIALIFFKEFDSAEIVASNGFFKISLDSNLWTQYYAVPLAISGLVYCIWDIFLLKKHQKTIAEFFSFDEKINLKWVSHIVYSYFILFTVASFLIFGSIHLELFPIKIAFTFVGIALSTMLIAFGFYGFKQTAIFSNLDAAIIIPTKTEASVKKSYAKSGLTQEDVKRLASSLSQNMKEQKPFLIENLNLKILAEQCEILPTQLSQIINQHFEKHFYDFINQYRVEEAKQKLTSSKFDDLSLLGVAFECGFKSKSSFNRYFKKYTGVSPSEFKKKQLE